MSYWSERAAILTAREASRRSPGPGSWLERYRRGRREALAEYGIFPRAARAAVALLERRAAAGTVLPEDAQPVLNVLRGRQETSAAKIDAAIKAASWLVDPKREILTSAEAKRVASGRPRHLTPLEVLSLF